MSEALSTLEKNVEEFELILTGGLNFTDTRLIDRINEIRCQLKSRCLKGELSDEIVKRPIDQLISLLNVIRDPSDLQINEKIRSIDAQRGLIERRLNLLKDIEHLKTNFKADDLQNAERMEEKLDELIVVFNEIHEKLRLFLNDLANEQEEIDQLFRIIEYRLHNLENTFNQ
ncbi:hypothetical protein M3Y95_00753600 [Aphelenchoides besseyi]|nr:hypothetical protein M3Y95_00753600 [Aphelenchoides besseyi]